MGEDFFGDDDAQETIEKGKFFRKTLINYVSATDNFIQIAGYAKNVNASQEFTLDDSTAQIRIRDHPETAPNIEENQICRVFGQYLIDPMGTPYISARIIQFLPHLNMELYKKILQLQMRIK